jgi:hypothetical protein
VNKRVQPLKRGGNNGKKGSIKIEYSIVKWRRETCQGSGDKGLNNKEK